jgi:AraC-like DNA-binding protein
MTTQRKVMMESTSPEDASDWMFKAPGRIARIEACFSGAAFTPHRHDTYAVGVTLEGVQSFDYRGAARHSLPGQIVVLHPDELHDGRSGDGSRFRYRTAYLAPADMQHILAGRALPFIEGGVSQDPRLGHAVSALLEDFEHPLDALEFEQGLHELTIALLAVAGVATPVRTANHAAVARARDYIDANLGSSCRLDELERASGYDRWQLSRDFRALLGASPYRYLIFRRLDAARRMMAEGLGLADIAYACGFSDQSHFTRHFKKAFGMTPKAWAATHKHSRPT